MSLHHPVFAGSFYPAAADELDQTVSRLLTKAPSLDVPPPKAVILPHAGYQFSGAVAAAGASVLRPEVSRVVVLGPSHRHAFKGVALPGATEMATPLGNIQIDQDAATPLLKSKHVRILPEAFAQEHSIEVELPFLQKQIRSFQIVPLVVGEIKISTLADILAKLWGGPETLIVISTDLTHFLTGEQAAKIDGVTAQKIELLESTGITGQHACGHRPLGAFLQIAREKGLRVTRLALTHSGAITGDDTRVVGYGAWMAHDPEEASLSVAHKREAFQVAAKALLHRARKGKAPAIDVGSFAMPLQSMGHSFVTVTLDDRLRGCIGSLQAHQPLIRDVLTNAVKAGFEDPRFKPMTEEEFNRCQIEIAVLSHPARMTFATEEELLGQLRPGRDGLILRAGNKRGTFLPKVWENLETPEKFLRGLKVKAGLSKDAWPSNIEVSRYVTESFKGRVGPA
jgi:AmmeMemoRadiSam system protein B/AmmeMemoRadiSam system protein A